MANSITVTNTFSAGNKAKSAEVNTNFNDLCSAMNSGNRDPYFGYIAAKVTTTASNFAFGVTDSVFHLAVSTGASTIQVTLPAATASVGRLLIVSKEDTGSGSVVLSGADTIDHPNVLTTTLARTCTKKGDAIFLHSKGGAGENRWGYIGSTFAHRLGQVDATAAAAGEIGERIAVTPAQTAVTTSNSETDVGSTTMTLTAGNWLLFWSGPVRMSNNAGAGRDMGLRVRVTDSSNTAVAGSGAFWFIGQMGAAEQVIQMGVQGIPISINTATAYKLRITAYTSGGTFTSYFQISDYGLFTGTDNEAFFYAIRMR